MADDGKVPPDLFSLSDDTDGEGELVMSGGGSGRFGSPKNAGVDLATAVPDEDAAVEAVANRFRKNKLAEVSMPTLDEQGAADVDDSLLEGFLLDALEEGDTAPDPADAVTNLNLDPEPQPTAKSPQAAGLICPSCNATNPAGMRFCVQCGGSLATTAQSGQMGTAPKPREAPPASDAARKPNPWIVSLISINEDGSDGIEIPLEFLETTMGRDGDTRFPTDAFLSPKHARLHVEGGNLLIEDLYSLNGTFLKLRDDVRLTPGDTFLMGRQVLRFERFEQAITPKTKSSDGTRYMGSPSPGGSYKVLQIGIGGIVQNVYCLPESGAVLGREKGDIIFPHDKFMSSRHAQIYTGDDGNCYLVDLNSSNGTWIKIWEKTRLQDNDFIFMGQQLFRIRVTGRKR